MVLTATLCRSRDAADLVVQGKGKFEELMVCSHEIAASTAQLVAASKVSKQYIVFILSGPKWSKLFVITELEVYRCEQRSHVVDLMSVVLLLFCLSR